MISDLQKKVKISQVEVVMIKEKCEKYVSLKNCIIVYTVQWNLYSVFLLRGNGFYATPRNILSDGIFNTLIM